MFNNIKQHTELGLAERIQPSATEIYSSQSIPTGETMPGYTRTHTSEGSISFSSSGISKVEKLRNILLSSNQNPSEGELCLYFKLVQKQYAPHIDSVFKDLRRWSIEVRARKSRYPIREDFIAKLSEYYKLLCIEDAGFPFETYFSNGANDTADAGAYLLCLPDMNREAEELHAIRLLSAVQWLIRERDKLPVESAPVVLEVDDATEEESEKQEVSEEDKKLVEVFRTIKDMKDTEDKSKYTLGQIHPVLLFICNREGKLWAKNKRTYALHLAPLIDTTSSAIQVAFSRIDVEVKDISFDTMRGHIADIKRRNPHAKIRLYETYAGLYETAEQLLREASVI